MKQYYQDLAQARELSPRMQKLIWEKGDSYARSLLAKRDDLCVEVTKKALSQDNSIYNWAQNKKRNAKDITQALKKSTSDNTYIMLSGQENLTKKHIAKISKYSLDNSQHMLALFLLEREDLPQYQRNDLIELYIKKSRDNITDHFQNFQSSARKSLLKNPEDIKTSLKSATWSESFLIAHAAELARDEEILKILISKLKELDSQNYTILTAPGVKRDINIVIQKILSLHLLDQKYYQELEAVKELNGYLEKIKVRKCSTTNLYYKELNCQPDLVDKDYKHSHILKDIIVKKKMLDYPQVAIALETLYHSQHLTSEEVSYLLSSLLGDDTRTIIAILTKKSRVDLLTIFAAQKGLFNFRDNPFRRQILINLAAQGDLGIKDSELTHHEQRNIINYLKPLRLYLKEPIICSNILKKIESSSSDTYPFLITLLQDWEGTLPELLAASKVI